MAHENIFASASGLILKGKVFYNNAGSMVQRGSNFDLTEFGTHGIYTGPAVTNQEASDIVLSYYSTNLNDPIGSGEYLPSVTVDNISDIQSGIATEAKQDTIQTDVTTIKASTDALPADPASETNVNANETKIDTIISDIAALNNISVSDILGGTVEGTITIQEAISILVALAAGQCDGGSTTTIHYRNQADTKNRITLTVDANGDRSATAIDLTDL